MDDSSEETTESSEENETRKETDKEEKLMKTGYIVENKRDRKTGEEIKRIKNVTKMLNKMK